ncbi:hypothetical protein Tco_0363249 [Tanacetum coccineum]
MPTPPPSPLTLLSPPSAGERLARCTVPSAHSPPPPVPSPLLLISTDISKITRKQSKTGNHGHENQKSTKRSQRIKAEARKVKPPTLKIASTQAIVDVVTAALPSPPLPPLPTSLYIPPPVDRRDDVPESEQPPRKRSCLFALGSRYEVRESSTARPTRGRGVDYRFVSTLDAEERRHGSREVRYGIRDTWVDPAEAVLEIAHMTVREVNTRVTKLAELHKHDTQDLYDLLEDAQDSRTHISQRVSIDSQRVDLLMGDRMTIQEMVIHYELQTHREQTQHQMIKTLRVMRDMRREMGDMQAELLALREQLRRARQPAPDARVPDHQDASRDADSHI